VSGGRGQGAHRVERVGYVLGEVADVLGAQPAIECRAKDGDRRLGGQPRRRLVDPAGPQGVERR